MKDYRQLTKAELIRLVEAMEKRVPVASVAFEHERVLHELQVHQIELETQNRELREAQQLIELSRDRYADLFDFAPVGYVTLDEKGIIREVNLTAAGMLGVERGRLINVPFHLHVLRADLAAFRAHLHDPDQRAVTEVRLLRKGQEPMPVLLQSVLVEDEAKEGLLFRTTITDLTERKQAEQALQESTELSGVILHSLSAHIAVLDQAGNIIAVNEAWRRFAEENGDQQIARSGVGVNYLEICRQAIDPADESAQKTLEGIRAVLDKSLPEFSLEYPCHSPTEQRWFFLLVTPLSGLSGGAVISHQDITRRRLAEEALASKEARLRVVLDTAVDGIITIDEHGIIESVNQAAMKMFGYTAGELIGQNVSLLMPSPDREQHDRYLANYCETGEHKIIGLDREVLGRRKDGSTFPHELSVSEVQLDGRRIFTGIVRDITRRKEAEKALRLFRTLVDHSTDTFEVIDPETGRFLDVNEKGPAELGCTRAQYLSRRVMDIDPRINDTNWPRLVERIRTHGWHIGESIHRREDGTTFPIEFSAKLVRLDRDYIVTVVRDITERRRTEAALHTSEERLAYALDAASDGLWDWNIKTGAVYFSPRWIRLLGYEPEEVPPSVEFWKSVVHPDDLPRVMEALQAHFDGHSVIYECENRLRLKSGEYRWNLDRGKVVEWDKDGTPLRMVGTDADISERKRAEEALRESEAQLHSFVQQAPAAIAMFDRNMICLAASRRWTSEYGRGHRDLVGLSHYAVHPDLPARWREVHRRALAGEALSNDDDLWEQADGSKIWLRWAARPWLDAHGDIGGIMIMAEDITARKIAEEALLRRTRQQQVIAELGQHALAGRDFDQLLLDVVEVVPQVLGLEFCRILELQPESGALVVTAGTGWRPGYTGHHPVDCGSETMESFTLHSNEPVIVEDYRTESRFSLPQALKDHGVASGLSVVIHRRNRPHGVLGACTCHFHRFSADDIHFVQAIANILSTALDRRDLEEELVKTSDEERARFGRDLHDDLCQQLTGIEMHTEVLKKRLARQPKARQEAERIGDYIRKATLHARTLARGLAPVRLEGTGGLMAALQDLASNTRELFGIACEFHCDTPVPLADPSKATHLYRITQEAISNAVRHGKAKHVVVSLEASGDSATLTIEDDGSGCTTPIWKSTGMGLRTMQYRSEMIGATLRLEPGASGGTVVTCDFQLS